VFSKQWPEPSSEDLGFGEELQLFGEAAATNLPRKTLRSTALGRK
jgi:hypothetical protein